MLHGGLAFVETIGRRGRGMGIGMRYAGLRGGAVVGALILQTRKVWGSDCLDARVTLRVGHFDIGGWSLWLARVRYSEQEF